MKAILAAIAALVFASTAFANVLEVPSNGGEASGIGFFAGWKCPPNDNITLVIDGGDPLQLASGVRRGDTAGVCGNDGRNGYISEYNFGLLGDGDHTVSVRQDGMAFATATFHVTTFGTPFMRGAAGTYTLPNFPSAGATTTIEWSEGAQSFVVTARSGGSPTPTPTPVATPTPDPGSLADLIGTWSFSYAIGSSNLTDEFHLESTKIVDGIEEIDGFDGDGNLVVGGALQDVFPGSGSTLHWALIRKAGTTCTAYLFDRSGDTASGEVETASIVGSNNCGTFAGSSPLTGVRTSQSATAGALATRLPRG